MDLEYLEELHHRQFEEKEVRFDPTPVLSLTVVRYRNIKVSTLQSMLIDTPDPKITVSCPSLKKRNRFTTVTKVNKPTAEVNETFTFVLPKYHVRYKHESFPIQVEVYDDDILMNDWVATEIFEANELKIGEEKKMTLCLKNGNGEVDIKVVKEIRDQSDFRLGLGLHESEKRFRKNRFPKVFQSLQTLLKDSSSPTTISETPIISLVGSGGGYRAIIGMCGAMEAFRDAGIFDAFTYVSGISGSAWYLSSAYARGQFNVNSLEELHDHFRNSFNTSFYQHLLSPIKIGQYENINRFYYKANKKSFNQPSSFVDFFGYTLGHHLLGDDKLNTRLSDLQNTVDSAQAPYPLFVAVHVKDTIPAHQFHSYMETSPHEISFPEYGIGLDPQHCGSVWNGGLLARKCPELPLHFYQGSIGSAFAILLKDCLERGSEETEDFYSYVERLRLSSSKSNSPSDVTDKSPKGNSGSSTESESEDDIDEVDGSLLFLEKRINEESCVTDSSEVTDDVFVEMDPSNLNYCEVDGIGESAKEMLLKLKNWELFTNRTHLIGRAGKIFNFAHGFNSIEVHGLNPLNNFTPDEGYLSLSVITEQADVIDKLGKKKKKKMSTRKASISIVDAGILKNVPTESVLRPQRNTDLLLVLDFSENETDGCFHYRALLQAATHAITQGIKFPPIDLKKIANSPPKEFQVFESNEDDCPTVLWFTLCNKGFRNLKDYQPRSTATPPKEDGTKFNDFSVFGDNSKYSTFTMKYSNYDFDRLRELMYFNVMSNVEEIKSQIGAAVQRKRRKISKAE
ncbi:cytosolic phospholipase A2-like [Ciona intestinalis]